MHRLAVVDFGDVLCERRLDWSKDIEHWRVFINMFKFHRIGKFLNNLIGYLRLNEGHITLYHRYTVRHWHGKDKVTPLQALCGLEGG
jgi:hypothetical protein